MARGSKPPQAGLPKLSPEKAIRRLEQRIAELQALDCASVTAYDDPELSTLRRSISATLEDAFGQDSSDYQRFSDAGAFRQTRIVNMGGAFGRGARGPDFRQVREDCAKARDRNIAILRSAVQVLVERVEDEVVSLPMEQAPNVSKDRAPVMHFHNVHNITGNIGVGNISGAIGSIADSADVRNFLSELKKNESELAKLPGLNQIPTRIRELESELGKPTPDRGRLTEIITDIRNVLSGAAGNMLAAGALALLQQAFTG